MKRSVTSTSRSVLIALLLPALFVGLVGCPNPGEPEPDGGNIEGTGVAEFLDADGADEDHFGCAVCIDGDYAIIGAEDDDDPILGNNSGSAHIFDYDGSMWHKRIKLTADDGAAYDQFGCSVSLDGDYAIVGAYGVGSGTETGAAYVFVRDGTTWNQQAKLTGSPGYFNQEFGGSVAIDGDYAIVGAYWDDDNDASGSAYVFVRDPVEGWKQQAKLLPDGAVVNGGFGSSVAIRGDRAVIGDRFAEVDGVDQCGAAYVFVRSGTAWIQQVELTPGDVDDFKEFGASVSFNGTCAVVGAHGDAGDSGYDYNIGAAYLFVRSGTSWTERAKLTAWDGVEQDYFGIAVSVSDAWVLVGAHMADPKGDQSGAAYLFK